MKNNSFKPLPPFKGWALQNFPFIEEDFDAITSYQLWCKVVDYLRAINNNVDVLAEQVLEMKNFFDNLDLQEEVNTKLDEMAESGELTDIIAQYLQLAGILAFNTLNDLKGAENLANGSFTRIYGKLTYNDGLGAFYKIRTLINTDVIDNDNLVALTNYPTLVAEKIKDKRIDDIEDTLSFELTGRTILLGDSYGDVRNGVAGWTTRLQAKLGLSNNNCYKYCSEGGFVTTPTFQNLLENNLSNITNKETIKNIIVIGGDNDRGNSYEDIQTAIKNFENYVKINFPNAKIYLGFFLYSSNRNKFVMGFESTLPAYSNLDELDRTVYLNNLEYCVRDTNMLQADGVHLNELGQKHLTQCIYNCFITGSCVNYRSPKFFELTYKITPTNESGYKPYIQRNNENVSLSINTLSLDFDTTKISINFNSNTPTIYLADWINTEFLSFLTNANSINCHVKLHATTIGWIEKDATLVFDTDNKLNLVFKKDSDLATLLIDNITFIPTQTLISSRMC